MADEGTIFLDERGDISAAMQVRLLRVLQERYVEPLGATDAVKINVRVIAAANKDLSQLVREGKFREDLFYQIRVVHIKIPALRERREDIPLRIDKLVDKFNQLSGKNIAGVSQEVLVRLMDHDYPGNMRELGINPSTLYRKLKALNVTAEHAHNKSTQSRVLHDRTKASARGWFADFSHPSQI